MIFGHWPNCEAEFFIFLILNLDFRGVPSLLQGIVLPPNLFLAYCVTSENKKWTVLEVILKLETFHFQLFQENTHSFHIRYIFSMLLKKWFHKNEDFIYTHGL